MALEQPSEGNGAIGVIETLAANPGEADRSPAEEVETAPTALAREGVKTQARRK